MTRACLSYARTDQAFAARLTAALPPLGVEPLTDTGPRLPAELVEELRWALVKRSRDPEADLRHRIACGVYPIGGADPIAWSVPGVSGGSEAHMPRHEVEVAGFRMGQFAVTHAEWAQIVAAGGYEDERWWETEDAPRWRERSGYLATPDRGLG